LLIAGAAPLIAFLPEPVLAAVVIAALAHALDPAPLLRLWKLDRDQYVALGAAAGVLLLGVLNGMLVAIALSLAALVQRLAVPHVARLGRLGGGHDFVDLARHPDAASPPGIAIWRPAEPLFFANAERILAAIARATRADPGARAIVISLEESFDLDSTALEVLVEADAALRAAGIRVRLARVHDHVRDLLAAAGAGDLAARGAYSVDDAVGALAAPAPDGETKR
jgi:anti-anti-sigma factor